MRRGPLLACVAAVLAAHAALLATLWRSGGQADLAAAADGARDGRRLVILDAARVAALSVPAAPAPAPGASAAPPAEAASATADAQAAADDASRPVGIRLGSAAGIGLYRPSTALDTAVRTRSAPDLSLLNGLTWSGLPLRIRLFIDADGHVVDVQVLQSAEQPEVIDRVRRMFLATGFTSGTQGGRPVPCYKDIEMNVGNAT